MTKALFPLLLIAGMTHLYAQQPDGVYTRKVENVSITKGVSTAYINEKSIDFIQLSELSAQKDQIT